ncbi:hypothetical protein PILCRDRAFT_4666 [Piloderma croceum F 1598]|uniref:BTB domain-containing protein n=1 Tax=Piloderma croceum (strain F 1598) TaxID=765440 RepID=A0A0C3G4N6_PILCF|nr:hypothetical protein PILCRDRAFT_4666 [Piloderma croceum F 1598]
MSATTIVEETCISIHSEIKFLGITSQADKEWHTFKANFDADWTLQMSIFKPPIEGDRHMTLWIQPPRCLIQRLGKQRPIKIRAALQSLSGETYDFSSDTFIWSASHLWQGWEHFTDWGQLWLNNPQVRCDDGFRVIVDINSMPPPVPDALLFQSVSRLIQGEDIIDTKFWLFSGRSTSILGTTDANRPLPLYANSKFLASRSDYFATMFSHSSYSESVLLSFDQPPAVDHVGSYDYESDSDLECVTDADNEDENIRNIDVDGDDRDEAETDGGTVARTDDEVHQVDKEAAGENDDSGHRQKVPDCVDETNDGPTNRTTDNQPVTTNPSPSKSANESGPLDAERGKVGKVILVTDAAYVTWKAMLFYLYTDYISFAPRTRCDNERKNGVPPKPSAKSMYRLADKLGLQDLCELALNHIKCQLSEETIIDELFCPFTSQYEAVRDCELAFLFEHWNKLKTSDKLTDTIASVARGELPYATDILTAIIAH